MTKEQATIKLQRVHAHLRGKAEVLETLALKVLRGDEDLGSALRLKAEELQRHLLRHMIWEEDQLIPLLSEGESADPPRWVLLLRQRREQRLRLSRSLFALKYAHGPATDLARESLLLVAELETAIVGEELEVLPAIAYVAELQIHAGRQSVRREVAPDRTPR